MKRPKLLLHMGVHRTGTTYLQDTLAHNRPRLKEAGICYPRAFDRSLGNGVAWKLMDGRLSTKEFIEKVQQECEGCERIIVSDEDFSQMRDTAWLKKLAGHFDIEVFVYLRRQDIWLESWYNQHVRWPWVKKFSTATPEQFLKHLDDFYWIDYAKLLGRIASVVPKERIHVEVVDILGVNNTTRDFFKKIDFAYQENKKSRENASISAVKLQILRRIDLLDLSGRARHRILTQLRKLRVPEDDGSTHVFSDEEVAKILERYEESNARVAKEYFGRSILFGDRVKKRGRLYELPEEKAMRYMVALLKMVAEEK